MSFLFLDAYGETIAEKAAVENPACKYAKRGALILLIFIFLFSIFLLFTMDQDILR